MIVIGMINIKTFFKCLSLLDSYLNLTSKLLILNILEPSSESDYEGLLKQP